MRLIRGSRSVQKDADTLGVQDGPLIGAPALGADVRDFLRQALAFIVDGDLRLLWPKALIERGPRGARQAVRHFVVDRVELPAVEDDTSLRANDAHQPLDLLRSLLILGIALAAILQDVIASCASPPEG